MKKRPLRIATCCMAGTLLVATPVYTSPVAGAANHTKTSIEKEVNATAPSAGVSLAVSGYLEKNISGQASGTEAVASNKEKTADTSDSKKAGSKKNKKDKENSKENKSGKAKKTSQYANMAVAQVNDYVNIRKKPGEDGELLGKLHSNSVATVLKKKGGWYKIKSGSVTGYVKGDYIVVGDEALIKSVSTQIATVNTTTLKVRDKASKKSDVLTLVPDGEELAVASMKDYKDGWVKVTVDGGKGYVSADYVEISRQFAYAESKAEEEARIAAEQARIAAEEEQRRAAQAAADTESASGSSSAASGSSSSSGSSSTGSASSSGQAVVNYASQFVGNPYVYGGSSLTNGTDCSGFVMSVYAHFGISLPHSSSAQRSVGRAVSYADRQPGDIICYNGHVAIYVGNNTIVHASNPATGIKYTSPANYRTVVAVRRIF